MLPYNQTFEHAITIMQKNDSVSFWYLLGRSLLPSSTSFITSSILALGFIGIHLLLLSVNAGVILPNVLGSLGNSWTVTQSTQLLQPVIATFSNPTFNGVLVALIWGFVGWIVYEVVNLIVTSARALHDNQDAVYTPTETVVVYHPLRRTLIVRFLWRACIGVLAIVAAIWLQPLLQRIWNWDQHMSQASSFLELLRLLGLAYVTWLFIMHVMLIVLRLFLFRTRVFGEVVR